jgi:hypothetical protein
LKRDHFLLQTEPSYEDVTPRPEDFIKSIAEQGYRLETAIADLIDNSISAGADRVEVLLDTEKQPFTLYIADNGSGMGERDLQGAMRLPSSSIENVRHKADLGRFGLGLKTASFSQTRCFSVISRKKKTDKFNARTWDLEFLRAKGWALKVEPAEEISSILSRYHECSSSFLGAFDKSFQANTIVVWKGLHKFENYIKELDCSDVVKRELTEVTKGHLSLVFHRFMEKSANALHIRLNNVQLTPFNPFPVNTPGVRRLEMRNRKFGEDTMKVEGFVLPTSSMEDVKQGSSIWVPPSKNLLDMEGIYVYRADRIILFGGWLNLAGRSQRMQLARMRVEVGNAVDHLLHLNVSKSQVEMPHDLKAGLSEYVSELKVEAEREFLNRTIRFFEASGNKREQPFIETVASNRGAQMRINASFPLVDGLINAMDAKQSAQFKAILRMFSKELNDIRKVHEDTNFIGVVDNDGLTKSELFEIITELLREGFEPAYIKSHIIGQLGFKLNSLPTEIVELLKDEL